MCHASMKRDLLPFYEARAADAKVRTQQRHGFDAVPLSDEVFRAAYRRTFSGYACSAAPSNSCG